MKLSASPESAKLIEERADYYRGFHHTLVNWFITIMGFVFAGFLAADPSNIPHERWIAFFSSAFVVIFTVSFAITIGRYSGRISKLEKYLSDDQAPDNWRKDHIENAKIEFKGKGTGFFMFILLFFAVANIVLILSQLLTVANAT